MATFSQYNVSAPLPTSGSPGISTSTGTGFAGTTYTWTGSLNIKVKEWTKIKCNKCGKELGYIKNNQGWGGDGYYCEDCRLLEKLKE